MNSARIVEKMYFMMANELRISACDSLKDIASLECSKIQREDVEYELLLLMDLLVANILSINPRRYLPDAMKP